MKKTIWILAVLVIAGLAGYWYYSNNNSNPTDTLRANVEVSRGDIIEKALAVGTIEPEHQIEVKSKVSGVVKQIFAQPGSYVRQGDPLIEVQPDPTPLEIAEAKRNLELSENTANNITQQIERQTQLLNRGMISTSEFQEIERQYNDAMLRLQMSRERLELLESGHVNIGGIEIESVIKAPISGYILERMVNIGDPVVPLTSYQAGTALMSIADMSGLIFKGTVDEIDVGKLNEGMPVNLKVGALPGAVVTGELHHISLKARRQDNTTVFPVEIIITDTQGHILRAGYSANADIIIKQLTDILVVPERLITFKDGKAFVEIVSDEINGASEEIEIQVGSSNAISIEVTGGLAEGDKVLERPQRSLSI
ncbi:MAG: efflux RND transporter periplasmic adaptor subunit [Balneolales bacterium]|nr:efflux RND transporter periplasmic adaptor subunit [Balneolales bacterium]